MSEESDIVNWIGERRDASPRADEEFSADIMARICKLEAAPSIDEKVAAMMHRLVPERRREAFYLGGSAFAGALRVGVILYFVVGIS